MSPGPGRSMRNPIKTRPRQKDTRPLCVKVHRSATEGGELGPFGPEQAPVM